MNAGEQESVQHSSNDAVGVEVDWDALRVRAREAMRQAYVPYSRFPVGAAAVTTDGRVVSGCNVENASYGLTLCAECGLVSALHASGGGRLVAFTCCDGDGSVLMPCGRCRQLLFEHGGPGLLVESASGIVTLNDLLPAAFGPADLTESRQNGTSAVPTGSEGESAR